MADEPRYKRVLLKISGEALCRPGGSGVDTQALVTVSDELAALAKRGVQVGLVVGGGNLIRGRNLTDNPYIERATADYMGMLATVINGLALCDSLEAHGVPTRVLSAVEVHKVCEPFIRRRALRHLEKGRVVVLAGGLGSPYFTTDTAAAQRAVELDCDVLLKATLVDGVYDADPKHHPDAQLLPDLSFAEVLRRQLRVMDQTAFAMCQENDLPLVVFNMNAPDGVVRAAQGENVGTLIHN